MKRWRLAYLLRHDMTRDEQMVAALAVMTKAGQLKWSPVKRGSNRCYMTKVQRSGMHRTWPIVFFNTEPLPTVALLDETLGDVLYRFDAPNPARNLLAVIEDDILGAVESCIDDILASLPSGNK
jgi:hypothetical protein